MKLRFSQHKSYGEEGSPEMNKTLQREIHMARNIQMKLLNGEKPKLPNGEVSGLSIPARLIGGDYYDFYPLPNGKIRIIIGDVMGKGIPAAMLMILTRGAFRSVAETTKNPSETLTSMNHAIYQDLRKLGSFVTLFCADWDPETGILVYASAGHSLPIIVRARQGVVSAPNVKGIMLGGLPGQVYEEERTQLEDDDLVFFYTDGIVEAVNEQGEMFRQERLQDILVQHSHCNAGTIEQTVVEEINRFTSGLPQKDDITMVILKAGIENSEITGINFPMMS